MEESRRCCDKLCRHYLSHNQQSSNLWRGTGKHTVRNIHDYPEQPEFLYVSGNIQASDLQVLCSYIHEMDIPLFSMRVNSTVPERSYQCRMGSHSSGPVRRTGISDHLCHLHHILPHPGITEKDKADFGQHVQLCTADHCDSDQHRHRDGCTHMAESPGCSHGIRRSDHRQPQQESYNDKGVLI